MGQHNRSYTLNAARTAHRGSKIDVAPVMLWQIDLLQMKSLGNDCVTTPEQSARAILRHFQSPKLLPVERSHVHHDIVALGFGSSRAFAIACHASRSSRALFNLVNLSSARLAQ
jgi:hypothetical protein